MKYRPWGALFSALNLCSKRNWGFVGTLATEDRSLCAWKQMKASSLIKEEIFLKINPINSSKYSVETNRRLNSKLSEFCALHGGKDSVFEYELMSELYLIKSLLDRIKNLSESVVLDISSMPKRFYFLILRDLINNPNVQDVLLTYTSPESYTKEPLYEDIDVWKNLPGFGGDISTQKENLIVSIGFLVESLKNYLTTASGLGKVSVMFPFPSPLSVQSRAWEAVANLEKDIDNKLIDKYRLDTIDLSTAFDYIVSISKNSEFKVSFAPFGPKTFSVAMCLYAIQKDSAVYYPQPTVYHPDYSIGIKNNEPSEAVNAYWIKQGGINFYSC